MNAEEHIIRRDAIIASAVEQARGLIETHFHAISKSSEAGFVGDETQSEPMAKVALRIEWPVLAQAAKVTVRIGWSVQFRDESEEEVDPLQSKLGLPDDKPSAKVRALAAEIENAPLAVKAAAKEFVANIRKHNAQKEGAA